MWISKRNIIWDGRQKMAVEIQKLLCGDRKDNLIKSTCFFLKNSRVHIFCSDFSQVCIFYDDNHLKLVPEYMQPGDFLS